MRLPNLMLACGLCLGLAPEAQASTLLSRDKAHARCLITQVQLIGADTDEHYSSVLAKARAKCLLFERELDAQASSTRNYSERGGMWFGTSKDELIERSEKAAVEALFRTRARLAKSQ